MNDSEPMSRINRIVTTKLKLGWRRSDTALLNEYLRRLRSFEIESRVTVTGPFFSPSQLPQAKNAQSEERRNQLIDQVCQLAEGHVAVVLASYALWVDLANAGYPLAMQNRDLFEPLIRLFERGAMFFTRHGEACFEGCSVPLQYWREITREPLSGMSDAELDLLDSK